MRVAIVVQRYGADIVGGSEQLARDVAETMQGSWDVTVLTTCAQDYITWKNHYPEGREVLNGVPVMRFPVAKPRDMSSFSASSSDIENRSFRLTEEEERKYFEEQGPLVPKLVDHIKAHRDDFDVFIFFTYLYYTSVLGIPPVADKAYLVSTAHDEPTFYFMRTYAPLFHSLRGIIFLSREEQRLMNQVYQIPPQVRQILGGYGVPKPVVEATTDEEKRLEDKFVPMMGAHFFLFLGRATGAKRVGDILHAHHEIVDHYNLPTALIMGGSVHADIQVPTRPDFHICGYLTPVEKSFLLKRATALLNPSSYESLSIVILEAWAHQTPVIVNGHSTVMREHCDASRAGLYYYSSATLRGQMAWARTHPNEARALGVQGSHYVASTFQWDQVKKTLLDEVR